ncbi:DUF6479 family protein [Streptomyces sp. NPDC052207]|uniref:DUF6479 family protein n=1 Tax=Streptomyces sp. NPDC052207 TaxID=3155418 RepID=UPI003413EBD7
MTTSSLEIASGSDPLLRIGPFVAGVIVVALLIGAFWPGARIRGREPDPRRPVPRNSRGFPRAARSPRSGEPRTRGDPEERSPSDRPPAEGTRQCRLASEPLGTAPSPGRLVRRERDGRRPAAVRLSAGRPHGCRTSGVPGAAPRTAPVSAFPCPSCARRSDRA